jgi:hypothetical protein
MRSRWKFGVAVVVLVLIGIVWLAASWLGRSKPVPPEKIVRVERGDITRSVVAVGRIEALSKVEVKSKAAASTQPNPPRRVDHLQDLQAEEHDAPDEIGGHQNGGAEKRSRYL